MIEIPFNWVLINPFWDVLIFLTFSYFLLFKLYRGWLGTNIQKISWIDLEVSVIFILLGYLNYQGKEIEFFNFSLDWFSFIVFAQLFIEFIFILIYRKDVKKYLIKMKKISREKEEKEMKEILVDFKNMRKIMEDELAKVKMEGDRSREDKIKEDIDKISRDILELENDLKRIKEEKND